MENLTQKPISLSIQFSLSFMPASCVVSDLECFCPAEDHSEDCAFLTWDVSYAQEGRFKDKDFTRWKKGVKWNISTLKANHRLLWPLAGDSLKEFQRA